MRPVAWWKIALMGASFLISLLYALPSLMGGAPPWWPQWLPTAVVSRGLDLQGGLYLLLRVEADKAVEQTVENWVDEVRGELRKEKIAVKGVERSGPDALTVKLSDQGDPGQVQAVLGKMYPHLKMESEPGIVRLQLKEKEAKEIRQFAVEQSIQTIRSRIDQFGVAEPTIQRQGEERILVQLPGLKDPSRAKALIGRTARLEFKMVDEKGDMAAAMAGKVPPGDVILYSEAPAKGKNGKNVGKQPYLLKKRTVISGDLLTDARVNYDQFNEPYVSITFNRQGARKFEQLTGEHVGERMAVVLDNTVYTAPVIREKIGGGKAQITGSYTTEEAHDLAIVLRAGALPAPVSILEERTVGPTLGSDSITQGVRSMIIGSLLVIGFMAVYYKGFGWLANVAVTLNMLIILAALAGLQATLTLPGIAGIVLLVGMAVDANVLIYERIREELRMGKSPLAAIEHGYDRAFLTIFDSNITTLITALILFQFGTGPVRGFAVTLSIGIIASMFTSIYITRWLVEMILKNRRVQRLSI
ncbi:MAG: protein translocase subunit SecD [Magnetococcales bacterium]|nr:protein translocase subunit SecD [Magnetococcales bacterium]